jgi:cell wall-associated NlpC family hydrolase
VSGAALAAAARKLVGVPYRHDGRDPTTGLDCLGVLGAALAAVGRGAPLPARTALRWRRDPDVAAIATACGLLCADGPVALGDVLLVRCSPLQLHVLLAVQADRFVHAHAGLRRVVLGPRDPAWPIVGHWRHTPILED